MWRLKRPKKQQRWRRPRERLSEDEERTKKEAKNIQVEAEKQKKAEALAAQHKQHKLLLQHKVATCIAWEEDIQRVLEDGGEGLHSVILGYGKGKALEKWVCTNCLRKGIECDHR